MFDLSPGIMLFIDPKIVLQFSEQSLMLNQGSVQVFYSGSYFCEIIVIFVNFIVMFVKKLHAINFNY